MVPSRSMTKCARRPGAARAARESGLVRGRTCRWPACAVGALGVVLDDDLGVDELVGRDAVVALGVGAGLGLALGPEGDEAAHDLRLGHAAALCGLRRGRRSLVARLGGVDLAQEVGLAGREPPPMRDPGGRGATLHVLQSVDRDRSVVAVGPGRGVHDRGAHRGQGHRAHEDPKRSSPHCVRGYRRPGGDRADGVAPARGLAQGLHGRDAPSAPRDSCP